MQALDAQQKLKAHQEVIRLKGKEGLKNFDPDIRMSSMDWLVDNTVKGNVTEIDDINFISEQLLEQLTQQSQNVVMNAIRWLPDMIGKLKQDKIKAVAENLMNQALSCKQNTDQQHNLDKYLNCLQRMCSNTIQVPYELIKDVVVQQAINTVQPNYRSENKQIILKLIELIQQILNTHGSDLNLGKADLRQPYESFSQSLIYFITKNDIILIKKSISCLGTCTTLLSKEFINGLLQNFYKEFQEISKVKDAFIDLLHNPVFKTNYQNIQDTISSICRNSCSKISLANVQSLLQHVQVNYNELSDYLKYECDPIEKEDVDFVAYIINLHLANIKLLAQYSPNFEAFYQVDAEEFVKFIVSMTHFDPTNEVTFHQNMEENKDEESEDGDVDQDDSWVVRKAALSVCQSLLLNYPRQTVSLLYESLVEKESQSQNLNESSTPIVQRLIEKNDRVSQEAILLFNTFMNIICKTVVAQEQDFDITGLINVQSMNLSRMDSHYAKQINIDHLFSGIGKVLAQILSKNQKDQALKSKLFQIIHHTCFYLNQNIAKSEKSFEKVFSLLENVITARNSGQSSDLTKNAIQSLKRLFRQQNSSDIQHMWPVVNTVFNLSEGFFNEAPYLIPISQLLSVLMIFLQKNFPTKINSIGAQVNKIVSFVIQSFSNQNNSHDAIGSLISLTASLLLNLGENLNPKDVDQLFKLLLDKLRDTNLNQKNQTSILRVIKFLPNYTFYYKSNTADQQLVQFLNESCIRIGTQFFSAQEVTTRVAALEAVSNIIAILTEENRNGLVLQSSEQLVDLLLTFLNKTDLFQIQISLKILKNIVRTVIKLNNSKSLIEKILASCINLIDLQLIEEVQLDRYYKIFKYIGETNKYDNKKILESLFNKLTDKRIRSISRAMSTVLCVSDKEIYNSIMTKLLEMLTQTKVLFKRQFALSTFGQIGILKDLTSQKNIFDPILHIIEDNNQNIEEVRLHACNALGGIALGNLQTTLPIIIQKASNFGYLMLFSIKSLLNLLKQQLNVGQGKKQKNDSEALKQQILSNSDQILNFLFGYTQRKEFQPNLIGITAEAIGIIAGFDFHKFKPQIIDNLNKQYSYTRQTTIQAMNSILKRHIVVNQSVTEIFQKVKQLAADQDLYVRAQAVNFLYNLSKKKQDVMVQFLNDGNFFEILQNNLKISKDKNICQEIVMEQQEKGQQVGKKIVDKGQPLRQSAFNLLNTLLPLSQCEGYRDQAVTWTLEDMCNHADLQNVICEHDNNILITRLGILEFLSQEHPKIFSSDQLEELTKILMFILTQYKFEFNLDKNNSVREEVKTIVNANLHIWYNLSEVGSQTSVLFKSQYNLLKERGKEAYRIVLTSFAK